MSTRAIEVNHIGKEYQLGGAERHYATFREMLAGSIGAPWRKLRNLAGRSADSERFWALRDISFEVGEGEVVGIIGRNGAGKSTLLKIMSRITTPTTGSVITRGRVASLLEVGTGFHPELTGRENIFLNGAILGMTQRDINARFDDIVGFAEVERFLDTPIKRYSSGMYVRLAFSVAAHMDPDILLVDEVLAVGDQEFQRRCIGKMSSVAEAGRTVLFISHNLSAVSRLCSRGLVLSRGKLLTDAPVGEALATYASVSAQGGKLEPGEFTGPMSDRLSFDQLFINHSPVNGISTVDPLQGISIRVRGRALETVPDYRTTFALRKDGQHLVSFHDRDTPETLPAGVFESVVDIPPEFLGPGTYSVEIGGAAVGRNDWTWGREQAILSVTAGWRETYDTRANMGLVNLAGRGARPLAGGSG